MIRAWHDIECPHCGRDVRAEVDGDGAVDISGCACLRDLDGWDLLDYEQDVRRAVREAEIDEREDYADHLLDLRRDR